MNRRGFLSLLTSAATALAVDPDRLPPTPKQIARASTAAKDGARLRLNLALAQLAAMERDRMAVLSWPLAAHLPQQT